jgi:hypothetical protein
MLSLLSSVHCCGPQTPPQIRRFTDVQFDWRNELSLRSLGLSIDKSCRSPSEFESQRSSPSCPHVMPTDERAEKSGNYNFIITLTSDCLVVRIGSSRFTNTRIPLPPPIVHLFPCFPYSCFHIDRPVTPPDHYVIYVQITLRSKVLCRGR